MSNQTSPIENGEDEENVPNKYKKPVQCHHVNIAENPFIKRSISKSSSNSSLKSTESARRVSEARRYQSPHRLASRFEYPNRHQSPHRFRNYRQNGAATQTASDVIKIKTNNRSLDDFLTTNTCSTSSTSGASSKSPPTPSKNPSMSSCPDDEQETDALSMGGYSMQSSGTMQLADVPDAGTASSPSELNILKKRLFKANGKIKIMLERHKEEQNKWKSQTVELARVKRECRGLIENQRQELEAKENLQRSNEELKNQFETLRNENVGKGKQIDILSTKIGNLEAAAATQDDNDKELREDLRVAKEQNDKLQTSNDELNKQLETLRNDIVDKTTQIEVLTRKGDDTEEKLQSAIQERDFFEQSIDQLYTQLRASKDECSNLESTNQKLEEELNESKAAKERDDKMSDEESNRLIESNNQLKSQLQSSKSEGTILESKSQKLQEELDEIKMINDRDDKISSDQVAKLNSRIQELQDELASKQDAFETANDGLHAQVQSLRDDCIEKENQIEKLQTALDQMRSSKDEYEKALEEMTVSAEQNASLNDQIKELREQNSKSLEELEITNDGLQSKLQTLQDELIQKDSDILTLQTDLDQVKASKEEFESTSKNQITELEGAYDNLTLQVKELQEENSKAFEESLANEGLKTQLQSLQDELVEKNTGMQTLQRDFDQMKASKDDQKSELDLVNAKLAHQIETLREENLKVLEETKANASAQLESRSDQVAKLTTECENLNTTIWNLEAEISGMANDDENVRKEIETRCDALEKLNRELKEKGETLEDEKQTMSKETEMHLESVDTLNRKLQVADHAVSNLESKLELNETELTTAKSDLSKAKAQAQELQNLLDETNRRHSNEQDESSNIISTLESQIELARSQLKALRKENESISNDNKSSIDMFEKHVERLSLQVLDIESEKLASNKIKDGRQEDREVRESNAVSSRQSSRGSIAELFRLASSVSGSSKDDEFRQSLTNDPSQHVEYLQKENQRLERTMERIVTWNDELLKRNESLMERVAELEGLYEDLKDSKQPKSGSDAQFSPKSPIMKVTQASMLVDITRKKEREERERNGKSSTFLDGIFS